MHIKSDCQTWSPTFLNTSSPYHVEKTFYFRVERQCRFLIWPGTDHVTTNKNSITSQQRHLVGGCQYEILFFIV